jgi:hypothetical protein
MLIGHNNERGAKEAVFTADRDRLFGGQHLANGTAWSRYSSMCVEPSDWRGS